MSTDRRREELEEEIRRFVEFGTLLDRRTRRYLAAHLHARLLGDDAPEEDLDPTYGRYFSRALDRIFDDEAIVGLCRRQSALGAQLATEAVRWIRRTHRTVQERDPHADERRRLAQAAGMPLSRFAARWRAVTGDVATFYGRHEIDVDFYDAAFRDAVAGRPFEEIPEADRARLDALLVDLLAAWDAQLQAKRLKEQLQWLEEEQESFREDLRRRVAQLRKLQDMLDPFSDYLGRYWDMSRGLWEDADLELLERYAELLREEDAIRELAELLGRMREAALQTEEEELQRIIVQRRLVPDPHTPAEITGIRQSGDVRNLSSGEAVLFSDPATEDLFLQRLVDRQLLTFQYEDQRIERDERSEVEADQRTRRKEKGPFVLCVDTSYSMHGAAEQIAKVIAFAIMRIAAEEGRAAYLINFSIGVETVDLREVGRSLDAIAAFLRKSFYGGTDITPALHEAVRKLQEGDYREADVLVISDFIMYRIDDDVLQLVHHLQHNRGTRFHSLTIGDTPNRQIIDRFDTSWMYDPERAGVVRELALKIEGMRG